MNLPQRSSLLRLLRFQHVRAASPRGVLKCDQPCWPDESQWRTVGVACWQPAVLALLKSARGTHRNFSMSPHSWVFVTSIRVSCWSVVGTRSTKSGRRNMSHSPTTAYSPITQVSTWVSMLEEHSQSTLRAERVPLSYCLIIMAGVWLGRTTCWMFLGKRWICCEWQWRSRENGRLVQYHQ